MHDRGLRRGELAGMDVGDFDAARPAVQIIAKGYTDPEWIGINAPTSAALAAWLEVHPDPQPESPLFVRLDRAAEGPDRLDDDSLWFIVQDLGRHAGLARGCRPHGLRHQGISRTLELNGGNVVAAQAFARHSDPKTTMRYNDAREDLGGKMAAMLGLDA